MVFVQKDAELNTKKVGEIKIQFHIILSIQGKIKKKSLTLRS